MVEPIPRTVKEGTGLFPVEKSFRCLQGIEATKDLNRLRHGLETNSKLHLHEEFPFDWVVNGADQLVRGLEPPTFTQLGLAFSAALPLSYTSDYVGSLYYSITETEDS